MRLEGSCHCGAVRFSLTSQTPYPYMRCYCSICRKTAGGGGYAINLMGVANSLRVHGEDHISVYQARLPNGDQSPAHRHFCRVCGSALWVFDPRWPDLLHPFASAIDTPLPTPPTSAHIMLDHIASWVEVFAGEEDETFPEYPEDSIEEWHRARALLVD